MSLAKKRSAAKAPSFAAARDREHANLMIALIGEAQRERARLKAEMNEQLARVKADYEEKARPHAEEIARLVQGVQAWCETNRDSLTGGGKTKTVKFAAGEVCWRTRPPRVSVSDTLLAISWYAQNRLRKFLRIKEELDKEAMLADRENAEKNPHIRIASAGENFVVKPFETELEEVA